MFAEKKNDDKRIINVARIDAKSFERERENPCTPSVLQAESVYRNNAIVTAPVFSYDDGMACSGWFHLKMVRVKIDSTCAVGMAYY